MQNPLLKKSLNWIQNNSEEIGGKRRGGEEYFRPQNPFTGEIQRFINQL